MRFTRLSRRELVFRVILALALLGACLVIAYSTFAPAGAQAQPRPEWGCSGNTWTVGSRVAEWAGDTGGLGSALPDGYVAVASSDTKARKLTLFLYDGDDSLVTQSFDAMDVEPGTTFPTGRFDPQGVPVVTYHDHQIKIWIRGWGGDGGGPGQLLRIYTHCGLFGG